MADKMKPLMKIPVAIPISPTRKERAATVAQRTPRTDVDLTYIEGDTPATQRDLYRTCFPDELRQTPVGDNSTLENDRTAILVNRSVQVFNTPFPVKPVVAEVVRIISALDENSQQSVSISPPKQIPVALEPPTPFQDSNQLEEDEAKSPGLVIAETPEEPVLPPPPPAPIINVEYSSWALLPTKTFSGFFVEGRNIATGLRANSSRIVERIDFLIVKSASGAIIRLIGPPDEKRMLSFYITRSLISLFSKGFPTDWADLVASEMNRLQHSSSGVKDRIQKLLKDLVSNHQPMSHSRDVSLASVSLLSSQRTAQKQGAGDTTVQLPPIVETPDSEGPRRGPHHFPIESFTPKNDKNASLPSSEEEESDEEEVREENSPLESSESLIESADLSDQDRQGNKKATRKKPVQKKLQTRRTSKPATKKQTTKKVSKTQQKDVVAATVSRGGRVRKMDIGKNSLVSTTRKEDQPSISTDLNPPSYHSKVEEAKRDSLTTLDLPSSQQSSQVEAKPMKRATRKPPVPSQQEVAKKTTAKGKKQPEVAVENVAKKPAKRRSQEPMPEEVESNSKRPKRVESAEKEVLVKVASRTTRARQAAPSKVSVVLVEKIVEANAPESVVKQRRGRRKVVEDEPTPPQPPPPQLPEVPVQPVKMITRATNKLLKQQSSSEKMVQPKNDEYEFLPESPPKKPPPQVKPPSVANNRGRKKTQSTLVQESSRQTNHPLSVPFPPSGSRDWSEGEIDRLKRAIIQVPTNAFDYWKSVANLVATRDESECFAMYNRRMDIQKSTHCNLMLSKLLPNAETSINCSPLSPEKPGPSQGKRQGNKAKPQSTQTKGNKKAITAGVGTLKRREQIRLVVEEEAADEWYSANNNQNDAASNQGGGLTQSERAALIGNNLATVTPAGLIASNSMVTAGGQALSGIGSEAGHATISSAFELPSSNKDRKDADKLVQKLRGGGKQRQQHQGSKPAPTQTLRKKAMVLDHLSPMVGKLKGFMPKNVSTPQIPAGLRHRDDEDDDTLSESESSLTNN